MGKHTVQSFLYMYLEEEDDSFQFIWNGKVKVEEGQGKERRDDAEE